MLSILKLLIENKIHTKIFLKNSETIEGEPIFIDSLYNITLIKAKITSKTD